jgi:8-oxo-dGTP pyrophosphatase MutT (NUDIX family)
MSTGNPRSDASGPASGLARMNALGKLILADKNYFQHANLRPKDAATLILLDRSGPTPKVLLGKRHHGHKFMAGKFVFPGGGLEAGDRRMTFAGALDPQAQARLLHRVKRPSPAYARALALAAIRETAEETGLLLGMRRDEVDVGLSGPWAMFAKARVVPDLGAIHFIGRAITPPRRARRFDARFFAMDASAIADRVEGIVGPEAELVELVWMPLPEARALDMATVTAVMLEELDTRIAAGLRHDLPVPFYRMANRRFVRELL